MVECPYCRFGGEHSLLKTWRYSWWNVYFYECPQCKRRFRYQVDPEGKKKSYVIKLGSKKKAQVSKVIKCPFCGFESGLNEFKELREPWSYSFYEVRMLECLKCKGVFNYYEGTSPRGKHTSFAVKLRARSEVGAEPEAGESLDHDTIVKLLEELGKMLGFYASSEETSPDKLYKYDCVWRDAPGHAPLKVFEVELSRRVDEALARLTHAYDLWHPELYLVIADERDLERARKLVEPRLSGAFTKIKDKLTILSPTTPARIHECLSREKLGEIVKQLSKR